MSTVPQRILEQVKQWDRGQIGDHIENQLQGFFFKTWADWYRHATEVCTLCKAVLERIKELEIKQPEADMPIAEVIAYFRQGRKSKSPESHLEAMIQRIRNS